MTVPAAAPGCHGGHRGLVTEAAALAPVIEDFLRQPGAEDRQARAIRPPAGAGPT
jgi:hypothetical protein